MSRHSRKCPSRARRLPAAKRTAPPRHRSREKIEPGADLTAVVATNPGVAAAGIIKTFGESAFGHFDGGLEHTALWSVISNKSSHIHQGDMTEVESILYAHSLALQTMFMTLSRRAMSQEYLPQMEAFMRLALKAQSQCRTTLEALIEMKNPRPVAFVRQANIANGPQQVNNAIPARTEALANQSNELLAVTHEEGHGLDTGTPATATRCDPEMAAVAVRHRPKKPRR